VRILVKPLAFAAEAKKSGKGMKGDLLEIYGLPLEFWSYTDQLDANFSSGAYSSLPVVLFGMNGHTGWVNSTMLKRAGIDSAFLKTLSERECSCYGVGKNFEPNGFLVDAGMEKIKPLLPKNSHEELLAAGRAALVYNYSLGITARLDPLASDDVLKSYRFLAEHGDLNSVLDAFRQVFAKDPAAELATVQKTREQYQGIVNLPITGIKIFAVGVVEYPSQTASLTKPYKNTGQTVNFFFEQKKFERLCIAADKQGLIIHVHARGDGAVKAALDDLLRFRELGVISALQLLWAEGSVDTIDIVEPYVDPEIYKWQYPARSVLESDGVILGASAWPVSSANVFWEIYEAITRKGPKRVLDASQGMPREAMFYAYTRNSARAMNMLDTIGSLTPGKRADLIVIDRDVLTVSP
jgi:predicted amidohydrolase YtcJ